MKDLARSAWTAFRGWRWWVQVLVALVVVSAVAAPFSGDDAGQQQVAAAGDAARLAESSTSRDTTTTTERQSTTTTTLPEAPEGGFRSGAAEFAEDASVADQLARAAVAFEDLAVLDLLTVAPERDSASYDRSLFPHWDDVDRDGCDTRCDVLTAQRLADGSWFSEWDGATEVDSTLVHIDHVVALGEAWRSGASTWSAAQRDDFADDRTNLLAVTAASNQRKGDHDAAGWFPSRPEANCLWARTVVLVKDTWSLSVDVAERDALRNLLTSCGAVPPTTTTTTTAPPPTTAPAPPPTAAPPPPAPSNSCTPGYSPCLPPASDYDCQGGSGNGPAYTGRVSVDHSHGDPYDLDRDGDGVGCE